MEANAARADTEVGLRLRSSPVAIISITIFLVYFGQTMIMPIIGLYAIGIGGNVVDVGLIFFAHMVFASVLSIPLGSLSDRIGRRKLAFSGIVSAASASLLLPYVQNPQTVMVLYALAGIGHSAYGPVLSAAVGDFASKERMATAYGWSQVGRSSAFTIGPAVGGGLAGLLSFENTFIIAGGVQLSALIFAIIFLPEARKKRDSDPTQEKSSLKSVLNDAVTATTMFTVFAVASGIGLFTSLYPVYAKGIGLTPLLIGGIFALQAGANAASRLIVARYSDRSGRRALPLLIGFAGVAFSLFFIASFQHLVLIAFMAAILGIFFGTCQLLQSTILAERATDKTRGFAMGLFTTSLYAGSGIGPAVFAPLAPAYGFDVVYRLAAVLILLTLAVFSFMARRKHFS